MPYVSNENLEKVRPSVTGIGWANAKQAAVYSGLRHAEICDLVASGKLPHSVIGIRKVRIRYSDIDEFMMSKQVTTKANVDKIVNDVIADILK